MAHAETLSGSFRVDLSTPKELGGAGGTGNNPEELFAAGYAACFIGALKFVGGQEKDCRAGRHIDHVDCRDWTPLGGRFRS